MWFANILYHFVGCLFIFWIMFFDAQRVYFWSSVYLFFGGLSIPTIGIGAGADCDGQVLVYHDMLGLYGEFSAKFMKRYANIGEQVVEGIQKYIEEVQKGKFPEEKHCFKIDKEIMNQL